MRSHQGLIEQVLRPNLLLPALRALSQSDRVLARARNLRAGLQRDHVSRSLGKMAKVSEMYDVTWEGKPAAVEWSEGGGEGDIKRWGAYDVSLVA